MALDTLARPRLLIAEDDVTLAAAMRNVLEEDFAVHVTCNGTDTVAQARHQRPDILVMDARMPQMDGLEACRALREDPGTADLPIIMVTGDSGQAMVGAAFAAGATDFMQKPFSISHLRARAVTHVMRSRAS